MLRNIKHACVLTHVFSEFPKSCVHPVQHTSKSKLTDFTCMSSATAHCF